MTKKKLRETIKDLPENFSIEELADRLLLMQTYEVGLSQSLNGQSKSIEQAKFKLKKWLR